MVRGLSDKEALKQVILGLLAERGMSQRQLAIELDTSPSNLNQRINAGSMRPEMIMKLDRLLGSDVLSLAQRLKNGEKWSEVLLELKAYKSGKVKTPKDYERIISDQQDTISELQEQVSTLIATLNKLVNK